MKYLLFVIVRGYLKIFYCSSSIPSAFSGKQEKVEYFKGCESGTEEKLRSGCNSGTSGVSSSNSFHLSLGFYSGWKANTHRFGSGVAILTSSDGLISLLRHWIWSNEGLSFLALKAFLFWAAGGNPLPVGGMDASLSPLQGSGCSYHSRAVIRFEKM